MISPCIFHLPRGKHVEIYVVRKNESISCQLFINGVGCSWSYCFLSFPIRFWY